MIRVPHLAAAFVAAGTLLLSASAGAHSVSGSVFCDVNQDQQIDGGDLPLAGVQLFIYSDLYSPVVGTTDATGSYNRTLESVFTTWMMTIVAGTLPPDSTIVGPALQSFDITPDNLNAIVDWLIDSPICHDAEPFCGDGVLDPGEQCDDGNNVDGDGCSATCEVEPFCGDGVLDPGEQCDDGNNVDGDGCSATCEMEEIGEGCTPGFWKQEQHFDRWTPPLTPTTPFASVFEDAFPGQTLLDVMENHGGGLRALGRHIVAALLNAASPDVDYDESYAGVVTAFNDVFPGTVRDYNDLKKDFEALNEQFCPLD